MTALRYGLLGAALAATATPASAFGIGLQPTTVEMSVQPGDRQRQVVNLGNVHQEKTISLTLGLADWALDENGQIQLTPPGETDSSAAEWVRFSPASQSKSSSICRHRCEPAAKAISVLH
ncbi:MAG: hypothetical protein P8H62_10325 [Henriciella sp.]|nr:hypothetical protein [Henriciella sp.]